MRPSLLPKTPARGETVGVSTRAAATASARAPRLALAATLAWVGAVACVAGLGAPASAVAAHSVGSSAQVAWVRRAASNFVAAELSGNGAGACGVLNAPLRATRGHRTCAERWDAKLRAMLREPDGRASLRADAHAIPSARVVVGGSAASIDLPSPLMAGRSRLVWSENCWMVSG